MMTTCYLAETIGRNTQGNMAIVPDVLLPKRSAHLRLRSRHLTTGRLYRHRLSLLHVITRYACHGTPLFPMTDVRVFD